MRRASLLAGVLALGACEDAVGTDAATSSAHPTLASATVVTDVVSLLQPVGTYRRWTLLLTADPPGTSCERIGAPLVSVDIYTIFDSAPRGQIPLSRTPPPVVFPSAYVTLADGAAMDGVIDIPLAASTGLVGTLEGQGVIDGVNQPIAITFDAPTCAP